MDDNNDDLLLKYNTCTCGESVCFVFNASNPDAFCTCLNCGKTWKYSKIQGTIIQGTITEWKYETYEPKT